MAKIKRIVVHCTGEPNTSKRNSEYYRHWFFDVKKWKHYGYHVVVYQDGSHDHLQPLPSPLTEGSIITDATMACGQPGTNHDSIHVAYVGGIDAKSRAEVDTRTPQQIATLRSLIAGWKKAYCVTEVIGHRDWPGVRKSCPCFDARKEYANV